MTPEEREAQQLARWLEQHPGAEPPADISPEVVEAVYALRPELAPAARVTVSEILERVNEGPLARATPAAAPGARREVAADDDSAIDVVISFKPTATTEPEEQDSESDIVVPFVDSLTDEHDVAHPDAANVGPSLWRRARPWLFGGGAVTLLAAALLLVVIGPMAFQAGSPLQEQAPALDDLAAAPSPQVAATESAAEPIEAAPAPPASTGRERSIDIPLPATRGPDRLAQREEKPAAAPAKPAAGKDVRLDAPADDFADAVADVDMEVPEEEEEEEQVLREQREDLDDGVSGGFVGGVIGDASRAPETVEDLGAAEAPEPASDASTITRTASAPAMEADEVTAIESVASGRTTSRRAEKKAQAQKEAADTLATLERQARPGGATSAAAGTIKAQLDGGDANGARDAARAAIRAGRLSNTQGADMHWVLGLSLQRLGDSNGATAAYNEAIRLRRL